MQTNIPCYITYALDMLEKSGHEAFIVGGCVRDSLINKTPNDWDICTSALPEQIISVFKNFKTVLTGIKHGTVCVIIDKSPVEITTYRVDGEYIDNRHPESISFSPFLADDLKRRDFTVNSMAYSNIHGLIDLNGGINDLNSKVLRCVGNPEKRFTEDALRIMRALRFSAQLGFKIENETKKAVFSKKDLLLNISAERITDEFLKLLMSDNYINVLKEFESVINVFLPNFCFEIKDITIKKDLRLRLAYVLSGSNCDINDVFGTLKIPNSLKISVKKILQNKNEPITSNKCHLKKMLCIFDEELLRLILEFKSYFGEDVSKQIITVNAIINSNECYHLKQLKISGSDINNIGIKSKTNIGKVLDYLLDLVIAEKISNEFFVLTGAAKTYIMQNKL